MGNIVKKTYIYIHNDNTFDIAAVRAKTIIGAREILSKYYSSVDDREIMELVFNKPNHVKDIVILSDY